MADAPTPAMARPTMSMGDDVAAAQMTDPISKMSSAMRYVIFMSKFAYIFPKGGLQKGHGEEVRRAIPADVVQKVEHGRHGGDSSG